MYYLNALKSDVVETYSEQCFPMCFGPGVGSRVLDMERQKSLWVDLKVLLNGSVGGLISVSLSELLSGKGARWGGQQPSGTGTVDVHLVGSWT